jgi:hypothetical protein
MVNRPKLIGKSNLKIESFDRKFFFSIVDHLIESVLPQTHIFMFLKTTLNRRGVWLPRYYRRRQAACKTEILHEFRV